MPRPHGVCSLVGEPDVSPSGKCSVRGQNGKQSLSRAVRLGSSEKQSFELRSERIVSVSVGTVVRGVPERWSALRGERRELSGETG